MSESTTYTPQDIDEELLQKIQSLFGMRIQLKRDTSTNWAANNPILLSGEVGIETDTGRFKIGDGQTNWNDLKSELSPTVSKTLEEWTNEDPILLNGQIGLVRDNTSQNGKFKIGDGSSTWSELPYAAVAPKDVQTLMTFRVSVSRYISAANWPLAAQFVNLIGQEKINIPGVDATGLNALSIEIAQAYANNDQTAYIEACKQIPDECIGSVINVKEEGVNYVWVGIDNDYDPEDSDEATDSRIDGWEKLGSLFKIEEQINGSTGYVKNTVPTTLTANPVSEEAVYNFLNGYLKDKTQILEITKSELNDELEYGTYRFIENVYVTPANDAEAGLIGFDVGSILFVVNASGRKVFILFGASTYTSSSPLQITWKFYGSTKWNKITNLAAPIKSLDDLKKIKSTELEYNFVDQTVIKAIYDTLLGDIDTLSGNIDTLSEEVTTLATNVGQGIAKIPSQEELNNFYAGLTEYAADLNDKTIPGWYLLDGTNDHYIANNPAYEGDSVYFKNTLMHVEKGPNNQTIQTIHFDDRVRTRRLGCNNYNISISLEDSWFAAASGSTIANYLSGIYFEGMHAGGKIEICELQLLNKVDGSIINLVKEAKKIEPNSDNLGATVVTKDPNGIYPYYVSTDITMNWDPVKPWNAAGIGLAYSDASLPQGIFLNTPSNYVLQINIKGTTPMRMSILKNKTYNIDLNPGDNSEHWLMLSNIAYNQLDLQLPCDSDGNKIAYVYPYGVDSTSTAYPALSEVAGYFMPIAFWGKDWFTHKFGGSSTGESITVDSVVSSDSANAVSSSAVYDFVTPKIEVVPEGTSPDTLLTTNKIYLVTCTSDYYPHDVKSFGLLWCDNLQIDEALSTVAVQSLMTCGKIFFRYSMDPEAENPQWQGWVEQYNSNETIQDINAYKNRETAIPSAKAVYDYTKIRYIEGGATADEAVSLAQSLIDNYSGSISGFYYLNGFFSDCPTAYSKDGVLIALDSPTDIARFYRLFLFLPNNLQTAYINHSNSNNSFAISPWEDYFYATGATRFNPISITTMDDFNSLHFTGTYFVEIPKDVYMKMPFQIRPFMHMMADGSTESQEADYPASYIAQITVEATNSWVTQTSLVYPTVIYSQKISFNNYTAIRNYSRKQLSSSTYEDIWGDWTVYSLTAM